MAVDEHQGFQQRAAALQLDGPNGPAPVGVSRGAVQDPLALVAGQGKFERLSQLGQVADQHQPQGVGQNAHSRHGAEADFRRLGPPRAQQLQAVRQQPPGFLARRLDDLFQHAVTGPQRALRPDGRGLPRRLANLVEPIDGLRRAVQLALQRVDVQRPRGGGGQQPGAEDDGGPCTGHQGGLQNG